MDAFWKLIACDKNVDYIMLQNSASLYVESEFCMFSMGRMHFIRNIITIFGTLIKSERDKSGDQSIRSLSK